MYLYTIVEKKRKNASPPDEVLEELSMITLSDIIIVKVIYNCDSNVNLFVGEMCPSLKPFLKKNIENLVSFQLS